jgi:hypothetical protein
MRTEKDQIKSPVMLVVPDPNYVTGQDHNSMLKWSDQRDFGTKKGFLGMKKGTSGRFFSFDEFSKQASGIQSK